MRGQSTGQGRPGHAIGVASNAAVSDAFRQRRKWFCGQARYRSGQFELCVRFSAGIPPRFLRAEIRPLSARQQAHGAPRASELDGQSAQAERGKRCPRRPTPELCASQCDSQVAGLRVALSL